MSDSVNRRSGKVVVLGIDGVPYTLLNRFADEGIMPNMKRLRESGTLCPMTASIPEVSSTSWSTFMTGVNPGKHGIYGFMEIDRQNYSWKFPNYTDLKSKPIWDIAAEHGKRSIVLNLPSTYPARPLNGLMVSGFVALDLKKATYPDRLYGYLKSSGYKLDVDATKAAKNREEFARDIMSTFQKRVEVFEHLFATEQWDLFIATITETDRLHHYLWSALESQSDPLHDFFIEFYRSLDRFLGAMSDRIGPDVPFIMLSDHGFTSIRQEVYLNAFLREKGHLGFTVSDPDSFADMDAKSAAFALDPSRIYIHRAGAYAKGCVADRDYEDLRKTLRDELCSLTVDGNKVIRKVYFKEDLYGGECFSAAPDLVVLPVDGYDLKGTIKKREIYGKGLLTGGHTRDNAFFYINRKMTCSDLNIVDVGSTVLQLFNIFDKNTDGRANAL